jgi:spermidine synthase
MNLVRPPSVLPLLFLLSGFCGVGYQLVWTKQFTAGLGHEMPALLAVMTAFFAGLALGGWMLDRAIARSVDPQRTYALLEFVIGGWGLVSAWLVPFVADLCLRGIGLKSSSIWQGMVAFVFPFLALLPSTMAMGATLPAMERWLAAFAGDRRCLGRVYALNTAGAVAGALGSAFLLMPTYGFRGSLLALAAVNLLCGILALLLPVEGRSGFQPDRNRQDACPTLPLFITGLLGIGLEVAGVRALSQVLENTLYTFAVTLAVFLAGTAAGAAFYQAKLRGRPFAPLLAGLLAALAASTLVSALLLTITPSLYERLRSSLGDALPAIALAETSVALLVFALPTLLMGATFSHLVQAARGPDGGIGRAAAWNTLGGAFSGVLFVGVLIPLIGTKGAFLAIAAGYTLLALRSTAGVVARRPIWIAGAVIVALEVAILPLDLRLVKLPSDAVLKEYREGVMASVAVVGTPDGHRALRVNNRYQMGGTAAALAERRQAHLPLLLHPSPERALFLGPGTGITLGAASLHDGLQSEGVELLPEVVALMKNFEPENQGPFPKPGVEVIVADARRILRVADKRYDVIVADLFHPALDGAGFLYTHEHFEAARARLRPGGLFCQWLPLHQLDDLSLRVIVQTFLATFSQSRAFILHFNVDIPVLGLVGAAEPLRRPADWLERRTGTTEFHQRMKAAGFDRTINLLGCLAAGPYELAAFAANAPVATDNFPLVSFTAPRVSARSAASGGALLVRFLERCHAKPEEILEPSTTEVSRVFAANLADYFAARDLYLRGLIEEGQGRLQPAIDLYLEGARRSLFFTPAYARCVGIVQMLAETDRAAAKQLFERLEQAQPAQPLGRMRLGPLFEKAGEP